MVYYMVGEEPPQAIVKQSKSKRHKSYFGPYTEEDLYPSRFTDSDVFKPVKVKRKKKASDWVDQWLKSRTQEQASAKLTNWDSANEDDGEDSNDVSW